MTPIGGFFELELPHGGARLHPQAHALSTGRACMMVMLRHLAPKRVHVPFYTCDAALEPFVRLGIETRTYALDETLFPQNLPALDEGEYLLWINYFGVCGEHTNKIKERFGKQALLDDTHAFFRSGHSGHWSFTSARKYFGVPDGAFLYAPVTLDVQAERFKGISLTHGLLRRLGRQNEAYEAYKQYERSLDCSVCSISEVSAGMLWGVDILRVAEARRSNFDYLHSALGKHNQLPLGRVRDVPFCYPYLPSSPVNRDSLYAKGIFVPSLWPDTLTRNEDRFAFEKRISVELLPLPIDHRYTLTDLQPMVDHLVSAI
jgi:hypothetical protein